MMTLLELNALVQKCTVKGVPNIYRELYGLTNGQEAAPLTTWTDWQALPPLEKRHLCDHPLAERIFASRTSIDAIVASSGTSGNPPVFSARSFSNGYGYRSKYHDFKKAVLSSMPTPFQQDRLIRDNGGRVVMLDPRRAAASVALAKAAGVDSMLLILHHIPLIGEAMIQAGVNQDIRFIEIAGETGSHTLFKYIRTTFPNAVIASIYGSSDVETSPIGIPCRPMSDESPRAIYHAAPRTHLELIEKDTLIGVPIAVGAEGDLLITSLAGDEAIFPLIRYRIGDTVRIVEEKCPEHDDWSFEVIGRTDMDFLKVPGGILRADEVARVLRKLNIPDIFQLHRYERQTDAGLVVEVVLHIQMTDSLELLAESIARELRIGPEYTYEQGVQSGIYLPLRCVPLAGNRDSKTVRLIAH